MIVVPALLETQVSQFSIKLAKIAGFADQVQVDFNDGSFGGLVTVGKEEAVGVVANFADKINFEAHLMVQKPLEWAKNLTGFKKIIVQYEIADNIRGILEELKKGERQVGLAIGPATSVFEIEPLVELVETITVLSVEPGKQGQKFMAAELEKIRELKSGNFPGEVQADGAIDETTITEVVEAGPDTLVVGSYIVGSDNPKARYEELCGFLK